MSANQMDLPALLAKLEEAGAAARTDTRLAREAIQDARQARRELDERIRTAKDEIGDYSMARIKPLLELIVRAELERVSSDFGKFAHDLYDSLNREARVLVADVIDIIDGTGDVTPAQALKARATIARFQEQESAIPGGPIGARLRAKEGRT